MMFTLLATLHNDYDTCLQCLFALLSAMYSSRLHCISLVGANLQHYNSIIIFHCRCLVTASQNIRSKTAKLKTYVVFMETEDKYVSLQLCVQNRRRKWNFPLNFHTMRKLSERYSGIFQTQSSGCASGVDHFRNFTKLKNLNI